MTKAGHYIGLFHFVLSFSTENFDDELCRRFGVQCLVDFSESPLANDGYASMFSANSGTQLEDWASGNRVLQRTLIIPLILFGAVADIWKLDYELKFPSALNVVLTIRSRGWFFFKRADPTIIPSKAVEARRTFARYSTLIVYVKDCLCN